MSKHIEVYEPDPAIREVVFEGPLNSGAELLSKAAEYMANNQVMEVVVFLSMERENDFQVLRLGLE